MHAQLRIHHSVLATAHAAGTNRMPDAAAGGSNVLLQRSIVEGAVTRRQLGGQQGLQRLLRSDVPGGSEPLDLESQVIRMRHVAGIDDRIVHWVRRPQGDAPPTLGPTGLHTDGHHLGLALGTGLCWREWNRKELQVGGKSIIQARAFHI